MPSAGRVYLLLTNVQNSSDECELTFFLRVIFHIAFFKERSLMFSKKLSAFALIMGASAVFNTAMAQPVKRTNGVLTDGQGKTLYIFTKDVANKSNCNAGCLAAWPAFTAKAEAKPVGDLGIITREDGTRQWTHKERPLYYYVGDANPGDKTGDKQGNVWFVIAVSADGNVPVSAPASATGSNY
jgi:predicted lipoprotein with Yx(FWY)xxD motif